MKVYLVKFMNGTILDKVQAPVGFSWTTFFFGMIPALFRKDWLGALLILIGNIVVSIVASAVSPLSCLILYFAYWTYLGYLYNKYYIESLIKKGYAPETDRDKNTLEGINVKF